nr:hypothetical protein [uncultured Flavobacterium sp.]
MNENTTKYPATILYRYIKEQGIAYDDICHELADHIICTLEADHTINEENFYEQLNAFIHSDGMVAMIVSAKEQARLREAAYRNQMSKGLVSVKGLLQLVIFSGLAYAAHQNEVTKFLVEAVFLVGMLLGMWVMGFSSGKKALPQYGRLMGQTGFYLVFPVLWFSLQNRFVESETVMSNISNSVCMAFITNILLIIWQVNKKHNRTYHA